ncbi:MAG: HprK-related kinase A [Blastomonas sp.]
MRHQCSISVGPARFRIGSAWRAPIEQLRRLYADYPGGACGNDGAADFTVRLEPVSPLRRLFRPSVAIAGDYMLPEAAPLALRHALLAAEMGMNLQMALGWRRHLLLHASAVERDGRAVLMTGQSGSGKSTLSALLGEGGWRFLGDEFVLLDPATGMVHPFPRMISLKNEAIGAMEAIVGDPSRFGPLLADTPKGAIRHLRPAADAIARQGETVRPALLLFPRFGHDRAIRPVGRDEAFVRLTQASTNYVTLGERSFAGLTALIGAVPSLAIDYRSGTEAQQLVEQLFAEQAA